MSDDDLLCQVAKLYYEQSRTQQEIAKAVNTSRSTISRLLQEAVDRQIVTITINYPWRRNNDLERRLCESFGLRAARVLDSNERVEKKILAGTGKLAAQLIDEYLKDGFVLGVSYGRSVAFTAAALIQGRKVAITVVPILGALGSDNNSIDGPDLVRQFAQAYGGNYTYLPGPLLVKDERTKESLMQLPQISDTLVLAKKSNVVVIGIGDVSHTALIWRGYLDKRGLEWVINRGAIGHMCGQFFDENGKVLSVSTNRRSIAIGLEALRKIDQVIAVACGKQKAQAILGALRGRYCNNLVTDAETANLIFAMDRGSSGSKSV